MPIIFVAGCGRSGTSYLRTILDAHPEVFIPNESLFIADYLAYARYVPRPLLERLFFREPQLLCWYEGGRFRIDDMREAIARVHTEEAQRKGARIWGQKTPRFVHHMDLFNQHFPPIKWLLIYRDPRGVAASMMKSVQHTYSVVRACKRWNNDNGEILHRLRTGKIDANVMLIKYEDLILSYDETLEQIFRFLSLEPINRDEVNQRGRPAFFKRSRFKMNTIRGGLTPDPRMINSWMNVLNEQEVRYIEHTCGEGMRIMGYEPVSNPEIPLGKRFVVDGLKDVSIFFQYLFRWPEYLLITLIRYVVFRGFYHANRLLRRET